MEFKYSCFFSYRRNEGEYIFIKNFNEIIQSIGHLVTNKPNTFFDERSILQAQEFDVKIYDAIPQSYFFILMNTDIYINKENDWCARELYRAIKVEEKIREKIKEFCFIFPFVQIGSEISLPKAVNTKIARLLKQFRVSIINKVTTKALEEFKSDLKDRFSENFKLIKDIDFQKELSKIPIPTDEELHQWIDLQLGITRKEEIKKIPLLKN